MCYFTIRIIIILIISLCFFLFQKKKGKLGLERSKKAVLIRAAVGILILAIVFIPYESTFIRFNSAEESVRYSTVNYDAPIKTIETDKTAFCVGHARNNFYYNTVTKYDAKYGFCDRRCQTVLGFINTHIDDGVFNGNYRVTKLINNDTNEKCYMISFLRIDQNNTEDISIFDENNAPIEKITFPDKRTVFAFVVNQIDEKTLFVFNGNPYELN